tara:strand:+ start:11706 stop:12155 length:450 start_codon:yes stop_codon:yes gene_type:complete
MISTFKMSEKSSVLLYENLYYMANDNEAKLDVKSINHEVIDSREDNPIILMKFGSRFLYMNVRANRPYNQNLDEFMRNVNLALSCGLLFHEAYYNLCCQTYLQKGLDGLREFMFSEEDSIVSLPIIYNQSMTKALEDIANKEKDDVGIH